MGSSLKIENHRFVDGSCTWNSGAFPHGEFPPRFGCCQLCKMPFSKAHPIDSSWSVTGSLDHAYQWFPPVIKCGNDETSMNGCFHGKVFYTWWIFHCHVWLSEGNKQLFGGKHRDLNCFSDTLVILSPYYFSWNFPRISLLTNHFIKTN